MKQHFHQNKLKGEKLGHLKEPTAPTPRRKCFSWMSPSGPQRGGSGTQDLSLHGAAGRAGRTGPGGQQGALQAELHVSQPCCQSRAISQHEQPNDLASRPVSTMGLCAHGGTKSLHTHLTPQGRVPVSHVRQQSDQAEAEALSHWEGTWRQRDRSRTITLPSCSPSHSVKDPLPAEAALNSVRAQHVS